MRLVIVALSVFATVALSAAPKTAFACACSDEPFYRVDLFRTPWELRDFHSVNGRPELEVLRDPDDRLAEAVRVSQGREADEIIVPDASWFLYSVGAASLTTTSDASDRTRDDLEGKHRILNDRTAETLDSMKIVFRNEGAIR